MSEAAFLSPDHARPTDEFRPVFRSPLERALRDAPAHIRDISRSGKLDVRGNLDGIEFPDEVETVRITPHRAVIFCRYEHVASLRAQLRRQLRSVTDLTGALAGLEVTGEQLLRRLTALDLDALPAAGPVADVPAIVLRHGASFRIFFPQEYGHYVAEVVLDADRGLA